VREPVSVDRCLPIDEQPDFESVIEQYLESLRGHLMTVTPETAIVIDEVRDHLWEAVASGGDPHVAIARFGDPGAVGRDLAKERCLGALEQVATQFARRSVVLAIAIPVALRCAFAFTHGAIGTVDTLAIVASAIATVTALALSRWSVVSTRSLAVDVAKIRSVIVACGASIGCASLGVIATLGLADDLVNDSLRHESVVVQFLAGTAAIVLAAALASGLPSLRRLWRTPVLVRHPTSLA
jgi:uncharacterized membrane protein